MQLAYLDTSAFVKLILREPEAEDLEAELHAWTGVSSVLLHIEAVRTCARKGARYAQGARRALATVALLPCGADVVRTAAALEPADLRSLDALHLATALTLGDRLGALFTYDARLAEAATAAGLVVLAPGA